ncbi:glycerophosphodiester phosphodiesterase family protein [Amorphus orientalis]|uniref:Glycerophosphoryl diester phosphodiesterase n=1 Tax=Amorphus orientalis TaxID=649198 RepID=A0AAE3VS13_9HYPH|nr:glycerophosphodiester phosphodiesterase family protein [Amorphus orientalis]MDQ0317122.1 glycerophosphoryl diester phosphodiesterase [Amorphus orientalis]
MTAPDWLTARPIAHRGLYGSDAPENSIAAAEAAIAHGYAIEVDLQLSADRTPMVFHDATLERMTSADGLLARRTSEELAELTLRGGSEPIPALERLLEAVAGRVPLFLELKSGWRREALPALAEETAAVLNGYDGPVALMSFDPELVAASRRLLPERPHGILACDFASAPGGPPLSVLERFALTHLLHAPRTRPNFIAYAVSDLPAVVPSLARRIYGTPLLAWTVRTGVERAHAEKTADQIIFEGFLP